MIIFLQRNITKIQDCTHRDCYWKHGKAEDFIEGKRC